MQEKMHQYVAVYLSCSHFVFINSSNYEMKNVFSFFDLKDIKSDAYGQRIQIPVCLKYTCDAYYKRNYFIFLSVMFFESHNIDEITQCTEMIFKYQMKKKNNKTMMRGILYNRIRFLFYFRCLFISFVKLSHSNDHHTLDLTITHNITAICFNLVFFFEIFFRSFHV